MLNLIIKIMGTARIPNNHWITLLLLSALQNSGIAQNVGIGTNTPLTRLHVAGGNDATLGGGGFLQIGLLSTFNLVIDDNEIMARINGTASTLSLNNDGGNIILGSAGGDNVGIGTNAPAERLHIAAGNIRLDNSLLGINLHGADRAMITRRFDVFTSGIHQGLGRWGLFMEPSAITIGFPAVINKAFAISAYNANSTVNRTFLKAYISNEQDIPVVEFTAKVTKAQTGHQRDLLPAAFGAVAFTGGLRGNTTKNITCTRLATGTYRITISPIYLAGSSVPITNFILIVTVSAYPDPSRSKVANTVFQMEGVFDVFIRDRDDNLVNADFDFVLY